MSSGDWHGPRVVFVHGIGGPRDVVAECAQWRQALAEGHRSLADWDADDFAFAHYGDLFASGEARESQAQGAADAGLDDLDDAEAVLAFAVLRDLLAQEAAGAGAASDRRLARVRAEVGAEAEAVGWAVAEAAQGYLASVPEQQTAPYPVAAVPEQAAAVGAPPQPQGVGGAARRLFDVCCDVAALPVVRRLAQWASAREMLRDLAQPGRYLRRRDNDADGTPLDVRVRERVLAALDPARPTIVVAHSLGSVVALEALAAHQGPVPLFVTIGSPIATRSFVWPLLRPWPPATPECVGRWLDFADRDDVVVPRRGFADDLVPNGAGVLPESRWLDSCRLWVHSATTYLRRPEVAEPVAQALAAPPVGS